MCQPEPGDTFAQRTNPMNVVRVVLTGSSITFLDVIGRVLDCPLDEFVERYEPVVRAARLQELAGE